MILGHETDELVRESRRGTDALNLGDGRVLCRVLGELKMFVDARDLSQMPYLALDGLLEPRVCEVLSEQVKPGMVAVDCGACFGFYTLLLARLVGAGGRVFAFEPHPRVFPMLKQNLEINELDRVAKAYPNALSDQNGYAELAIHRRRFAAATMNERARNSYGAVDVQAVNASRLDDIVQANRVIPDFYLLAVEGHEPEVWAGMPEALQAKRKVTVLLEFCNRWYAKPETFWTQIQEAGFAAQKILPSGSEPVTDAGQLGGFRSLLLLTR